MNEIVVAPVGRGARLVALDLLDRWIVTKPRLDSPEDKEAVHDFRVALRRLRSWLRAFDSQFRQDADRQLRRRLGRLATATGASRELEVNLAWLQQARDELPAAQQEGVEWLIERFEQRHRRAQSELRKVVSRRFKPITKSLSSRLATYSVPVREGRAERFGVVTGDLMEQGSETLAKALALVTTIEDQDQAHAGRIAAKRLRYLAEPLVNSFPEAKLVVERLTQLQDVLGEMHDADVFSSEVEATLAKARPGRAPGLQAIVSRLEQRKQDAFRGLRDAWLQPDLSELTQLVRSLAGELRKEARVGTEIERKYLLRELPARAASSPMQAIDQGYLPGDRLVERIRRVRDGDGERYYRTVKVGSGLVRLEIEEETTAQVFETMWPLTVGRRVTKQRYRVTDADRLWEIDCFLDRDLVLAEIELESDQQQVQPPSWLAGLIEREVTDEPAFSNATLAR